MLQTAKPARAVPTLEKRERIDALAAWELDRKRELAASLALLRQRQVEERRRQTLAKLAALWPLWIGILLGLLAPAIALVAQLLGPWAMSLVFPFVELANRPEIQVDPITHLLPHILLFAQFPIEGLVAWTILKRRTRLRAVAWQVALVHLLGILDLWMLSGGMSALLRR